MYRGGPCVLQIEAMLDTGYEMRDTRCGMQDGLRSKVYG